MINKDTLKVFAQGDTHSLIKQLETLGIYNPLDKVFRDCSHTAYFSMFWLIFIISIIPKMFLLGNSNDKTSLKKMGSRIDGMSILYGMVTIFKQYNPLLTQEFIDFFNLYIKATVESIAR